MQPIFSSDFLSTEQNYEQVFYSQHQFNQLQVNQFYLSLRWLHFELSQSNNFTEQAWKIAEKLCYEKTSIIISNSALKVTR